MRREEIIEGINQIRNAINDSNLLEALFRTKREEKNYPIIVLNALKTYNLKAEQFNDAAKEIREILGLISLEDPKIWIELTQTDRGPAWVRMRDTLNLTVMYLPKILNLIERTSLNEVKKKISQGDNRYSELSTLSVRIYEQENTFSSPTRLANVLESIDNFYYACAMMHGESTTTLSVVACDSGSDKSFDFLGLAKLVECVKEVILSMWDNVVYYKERKFEERLDLVAKSLPIIEKISQMEKHDEIDKSLGEQLKRKIIEGSHKFLQSGATIPQLETVSYHNPREILSPVQKLLVSAPDDLQEDPKKQSSQDAGNSTNIEQENSSSLNDIDFNNLSQENKNILNKLLQQAKNANAVEPEIPTEIESSTVEYSDNQMTENGNSEISVNE